MQNHLLLLHKWANSFFQLWTSNNTLIYNTGCSPVCHSYLTIKNVQYFLCATQHVHSKFTKRILQNMTHSIHFTVCITLKVHFNFTLHFSIYFYDVNPEPYRQHSATPRHENKCNAIHDSDNGVESQVAHVKVMRLGGLIML